VELLLPRTGRGSGRLDDRTVLNGIVWKFRTGVAWRDVPDRYGSWATLHTRFRRWAKDGTFEGTLRAAQAEDDAAGDKAVNRILAGTAIGPSRVVQESPVGDVRIV
jgi:transposase